MKRTPPAMVWRVLVVIAVLLSIHGAARLLYVVLPTYFGNHDTVSIYGYRWYEKDLPAVSFWNYAEGINGFWGIFGTHLIGAAIVACAALVLFLVSGGIYGIVRWIMYRNEPAVVCKDPDCQCPFDPRNQRKDNHDVSTTAAVASASAAVVTAAAISS